MSYAITPLAPDTAADDVLAMDLRDRAYHASRGRLRAILVNALDIEPQPGEPAFLGPPSVTSDGFLICNFVTAEGEHHMGAFAGAVADLQENVEGFLVWKLRDDEDGWLFSEGERKGLRGMLAAWGVR